MEAEASELRRVVASEIFRGADSLKRPLTYLGESALAGKSEELKEYTIGVEAFGRPPHYDPQADPTVRVQAGKLRQKLADYYHTEGISDPVRITIPKGRYQVVFEAVAPPPAAGLPTPPPVRRWQMIALGLAVIAAISTAYAVAHAPRSKQASTSPVGWTPEVEALWHPLVDNQIPIQIVYETTMFVAIPDGTFRRTGVDDPADIEKSQELKDVLAKFGNPPVRVEYNYAGFGMVQGVVLLDQLLYGRKASLLLKRSASLTWEEIQANHVLFLGVGKSKVQIRELLAKGDFQWEYNRVRNLKPRPGEATEYASIRDPNTAAWTQQYGLISMLPGFHEGRYVFVVGTGSAEGDWAAAEYVTTPKYVRELVNHLRLPSGKLPDTYQALIRIKFSGQVPVEIEYVTHHVLPRVLP